jgi:CheY-like chemotaxis protein
MRILIVEDNPTAREILRAVLELEGHEVAVAESGPRGLEVIASQPPDVALVDIGLPGLDGYQLARTVRKNANATGVFLVALTGYGDPDDRRRAMEAGFDAHMVKPFDVQTLNRILAERRAESV